MPTRRLLLPLSVLLLLAPAARAQGDGSSAQSRADSGQGGAAATRWRAWPPRQVVVFTGAAFNSPSRGWLGTTPRRDFYVVGISARWRVIGSQRIGVSYVVDAVPLSIVTGNPTKLMARDECVASGAVPAGQVEYYHEVCALGTRNAQGAGLLPVGLALRIAPLRGVALTGDVAGGAIFFDRPMPYPDAARLNYVFATGAALEVALARNTVVTAGYRLHHLSNGGRGKYNPGVGARLVYLGIGRVRGVRRTTISSRE